MAKYRKKPIVIEAVQVIEAMIMDQTLLPDGVLFRSSQTYADGSLGHYKIGVKTLEGFMEARIGDWIITGVQGEHYPCKPDIFAETYEAVDE